MGESGLSAGDSGFAFICWSLVENAAFPGASWKTLRKPWGHRQDLGEFRPIFNVGAATLCQASPGTPQPELVRSGNRIKY